MIALAITAAFVGAVPGEGASGFALAYAANSAILAIMWFRTGFHDRAHRSGAYPFSLLFLVGGVFFAVSAFTSVPTTYWLWGIGIALQWAAAVPALRTMRAQLGNRLATPSLVERFGLLVILVLGEVVAGAINGMADHRPISGVTVLAGSLGVLIAASLWWLYFELVSARMHRGERGLGWLYGHLPLIVGIIGAGGAVRAVIAESGEPLADATRWLLVGSVSLTLAGIVLLTRTLALDADQLGTSRTLRRTLLPAAGVIAALGFTRWGSVGILVSITAVSTGLVTLSIRGWLERVLLQ